VSCEPVIIFGENFAESAGAASSEIKKAGFNFKLRHYQTARTIFGRMNSYAIYHITKTGPDKFKHSVSAINGARPAKYGKRAPTHSSIFDPV
jgi:hypothetical protein